MKRNIVLGVIIALIVGSIVFSITYTPEPQVIDVQGIIDQAIIDNQ